MNKQQCVLCRSNYLLMVRIPVVCFFVELESILLAERVCILYLICMSVSINTGIKSEFMLQFK